MALNERVGKCGYSQRVADIYDVLCVLMVSI